MKKESRPSSFLRPHSLPPYPSYKDSGVERLGEIPDGWAVRRLKFVASAWFSSVDKHSYDGERPVGLCNYIHVYKHEKITPEMDFMSATASSDEIRRFTLVSGDVLVTKDSETWEDIAVPAYVPSKLDGVICGYHLALIRARAGSASGAYLARAFAAPAVNHQFRVAATGVTRFGLGHQSLKDGLFPLPTPPEQQAIAAFLDRETQRIDALVEKKERLVGLLQEKRTALISHAVTRGLDPNVRLKDSGVEWLGKIPGHWDVRRLRTVAYLQRGYDLTEDQRRDGTVLVVTSSGVNGYHDTAMARGPGVVTGRYGTVGQLHYVESDYWPTNTTLFVRDFCDNVPRYVYYLLSTLPLGDQGGKSAVPGVDRKDLHVLHVARPPQPEQRAVVEFLDRETQRIDAMVEKVRRSVELLKEYRTALISAAVTGKIDVRGAA